MLNRAAATSWVDATAARTTVTRAASATMAASRALITSTYGMGMLEVP
jgi:hypothetical protein